MFQTLATYRHRKTAEYSKHLRHIAIEKQQSVPNTCDISPLKNNRVFQTLVTYRHWKTTECSKHLRHIVIDKYIFSELNRCIFQISQNYIKIAIPKIVFILVLCNFFFFFFKISRPPQQNSSPQQYNPLHQNKNFWSPPANTFLKILPPPPPSKLERGGAYHDYTVCRQYVSVLVIFQTIVLSWLR